MPARRIATTFATALAAVTALAALAAAPASAKDGDVRVRGTCTAASTSKLKLSPEDGRIEVELEVDQNRNGVVWTVQLRRNGGLLASGRGVTRAPSGSFSLRRVVSSAPGVIVATATRPGERCTARASL